MSKYPNREVAGQHLAGYLAEYAHRDAVLVLALPRGGVPVAAEIARSLGVAFDVFIVRKLGVIGHEELAMGAIATGGIRVLNDEIISQLHISEAAVQSVVERETRELKRREFAFRGAKAPPAIEGKSIILVDDGLATGSTMRAAIEAIRQQKPERLIVAVPVGAPDTCEAVATEVDELICPLQPEPFIAVGRWYDDFTQTTDEEVRDLLRGLDALSTH